MYITFMSDFGLRDDSVGCCRGVIINRVPTCTIIDITHDIPPFDVRQGALTWRNVLPYMPRGVHLGIVDPGVGTARRAIAARVARGDLLVGPDNGLLPAGAEVLGGVVEAVEIANPSFMLEPRSSTFHGRDIFAPAAAALAKGIEMRILGPAVERTSLVVRRLPRATRVDETLKCVVLTVDHFGNLRLSARAEDLFWWYGDPSSLTLSTDVLPESLLIDVAIAEVRYQVPLVGSFGMVELGASAIIVDSYGYLMLAVNQGSAATHYQAKVDTPIELYPRRLSAEGGSV